ncbi:pid-3 [Pristionchus pacificus]|uniref:Uncharacterized protein n=1 Tax=Pristionchus pacificus TaxID=54126 RepID=A0A8R1V287_PRIPA|nr:pid-3 [Pristionchus pacificus]
MSSEDYGMAMKWAIVASIADLAQLPAIKSFGSWLAAEITSEARQLGTQLILEPMPSLVTNVLVGDIGGNCAAYEKMHKETPGVQLVVHILPHENSEEYNWMKSLSARYGLIRQGILLENALTHFEGNEKTEVLRNIIQWMARRSAELARGKAGHEKPFDLRVGPDEFLVKTKPGMINDAMVKTVVNGVLHGTDAGDADSSVRVAGLPHGMSEFQVASIFRNLSVCGVSIHADEAVVTLKNKFHAHQAAALYNKFQLDKYHHIEVVPLSHAVKEQIKAV